MRINPNFQFTSRPFQTTNKAIVDIIWINAIVFFSLKIIGFLPYGELLSYYLAFLPAQPVYLNFYGYLTSIFVHYGFMHILGNMLWLYFIGIILEDLIGKKHSWILYLGGGIFGVITYQIFSYFLGQVNPLVGASAGISAIIIATAIFTPYYQILLFGVLSVQLRWIAVIKIFFDLIGLFGPTNAGGYQAHLGGYLFGLLYITELKGYWHFPIKIPKFKNKPARSAKVTINSSPNDIPNQAEIDRILDKISASGYDNLTKKEKETLFKASNKR